MTKSPWGIDQLNEQIKHLTQEQKKQLIEKYAHFARCFSTEDGQKVLADLQRELDGRPTWDPNKSKKFGYYREGQNDVLKFIINRTNVARTNV